MPLDQVVVIEIHRAGAARSLVRLRLEAKLQGYRERADAGRASRGMEYRRTLVTALLRAGRVSPGEYVLLLQREFGRADTDLAARSFERVRSYANLDQMSARLAEAFVAAGVPLIAQGGATADLIPLYPAHDTGVVLSSPSEAARVTFQRNLVTALSLGNADTVKIAVEALTAHNVRPSAEGVAALTVLVRRILDIAHSRRFEVAFAQVPARVRANTEGRAAVRAIDPVQLSSNGLPGPVRQSFREFRQSLFQGWTSGEWTNPRDLAVRLLQRHAVELTASPDVYPALIDRMGAAAATLASAAMRTVPGHGFQLTDGQVRCNLGGRCPPRTATVADSVRRMGESHERPQV